VRLEEGILPERWSSADEELMGPGFRLAFFLALGDIDRLCFDTESLDLIQEVESMRLNSF